VRAVDHERHADRKRVLAILREYFTVEQDFAEDVEARYRWLYLDNPHGVARSYVAVTPDEGRVIGITSLFPRIVQVGTRRTMGAVGGDAFVLPPFRRRGVARALHRLALQSFDQQLSFMFGPPEPHNLLALLQAGARVVGSVRRYRRPFSLAGFGRAGLLLAPASRVSHRLLAPARSPWTIAPLGPDPDSRVDVVWSQVAAVVARDHLVVPVRDAAFYAWRFGLCPANRQHGYAVLDERDRPVGLVALERSEDGRVGIVDFTCTPEASWGVLGAVLYACRDASAVDIEIHVPARRLQATLAALLFVPRPRATKGFQVQARENDPLIVRPSAWSYMWGDGDVERVL
jgi:GNAT superfamily N-acetyltransferase